MKRFSLALVAALVLGLSVSAHAGEIAVMGSTTVQPIMQRAAEAYMARHRGVTISISAAGSGTGAKALIDGTSPLAMMSRAMKPSEIQAARAKGVNPKQITIALDCITPIVNVANPVRNLTMEQLKDIYTGRVRDWSQVGGQAGPIVVISRDSSSGTFEFWGGHVLKKQRVTPTALLQASNGAVAQAVSKNKYAIGYVGLAYTKAPGLRDVTVNGVAGSVATTVNHTYPISRGLYLYTNGEPRGVVGDLVKFVLSPAGQKIVAQVDYIPLNAGAHHKAAARRHHKK